MFNEFHRASAVFIVLKGRCVSPEDNEDNVRMTERLLMRDERGRDDPGVGAAPLISPPPPRVTQDVTTKLFVTEIIISRIDKTLFKIISF